MVCGRLCTLAESELCHIAGVWLHQAILARIHHAFAVLYCFLQVLSVFDSEMVFGEPTYEAFKFK